jgi:hypothetical protein
MFLYLFTRLLQSLFLALRKNEKFLTRPIKYLINHIDGWELINSNGWELINLGKKRTVTNDTKIIFKIKTPENKELIDGDVLNKDEQDDLIQSSYSLYKMVELMEVELITELDSDVLIYLNDNFLFVANKVNEKYGITMNPSVYFSNLIKLG